MSLLKIWTEKEFPSMGWHDCPIHAIRFIDDPDNFQNKLCFDIDYIIEWIQPENNVYFNFLICPCTLSFKGVYNLDIEISTGLVTKLNLEIDDIYLLEKITHSDSYVTNKWQIQLQNGDIFFESIGYTQIQRQEAFITNKQKLTYEERGGISFSED